MIRTELLVHELLMAGGPALVDESVLGLGDLLVRDESLVRVELLV